MFFWACLCFFLKALSYSLLPETVVFHRGNERHKRAWIIVFLGLNFWSLAFVGMVQVGAAVNLLDSLHPGIAAGFHHNSKVFFPERMVFGFHLFLIQYHTHFLDIFFRQQETQNS